MLVILTNTHELISLVENRFQPDVLVHICDSLNLCLVELRHEASHILLDRHFACERAVHEDETLVGVSHS